MNNLTKKQKIIAILIMAVMLLIIGIYFYTSSQKEETEYDNLEVENTNKEIEKEVKQESKEELIIVHITGEVKNPGIVELKKGSRVNDAILAAGGTNEEADLQEINLAYVLEDGQKIYIPNKEEKEEREYITTDMGNTIVEKEIQKGVGKKVNINEASQTELETLPGIGPSTASKIIEYRQANGKYKKIEDLQNVKGIGDSKFNNIKEFIEVK